MLKLLKLRAQLKEIHTKLADLRSKKAEFERRNAELETALDEAKTDEDLALVNQQIADLEKEEKEANIETLPDLEADAEKIEKEIGELEEKTRSATGGTTPPAEPVNKRTNREATYNMVNRRTILGKLSFEERSAFLAHEDTKNFLERVRAFKGQQRAVSGGELTIPTNWLGLIREHIVEYSKLTKYINLKHLRGEARQGIVGEVPEAVWTEAVGELNEINLSLNTINVDGFKVGAWTAIPNSILEDSDENLAEEILHSLAVAIGKAVDKAWLFGTGIKMPTGIIKRLAQTTKPTDWDANAPAWKNLSATNILKIDADSLEGAKFFAKLATAFAVPKNNMNVTSQMFWVMNRATHLDIMAKALAFNSAAALVSAEKNTMPFIGGDIIEIEGILANGDICGGYGGLYLGVERAGVSLGSSEHVKFVQEQTVFKASARYDGKPIDGAGFVLFNYKNQTPTTTATFAEDKANAEPAGE